VVDATGVFLNTNDMTAEGMVTITHCGPDTDGSIILSANNTGNPFGKLKPGETCTFRMLPGANINVRSDSTGDDPRYAATIAED